MHGMHLKTGFILLLLGAACLAGCATQQVEPAFFAAGTAEDAQETARKLGPIAGSIEQWVDEGEIVGAELLVIKGRTILLHEAFGWRDKEDENRMEKDTIFRIRSMTKPFVGTSVLILAEEGKLDLSDPVAKYLAPFGNPKSESITIEQLLTHTGGFGQPGYPKDNESYGSLREAVDDTGANGPDAQPGTRFIYSDAGTATLGALVAEVSGMPLEAFIEQRILSPLGMADTLCNLKDDEARRERISSTYMREGGAYVKYWDNADPQSIRYFRASGGIYSTPLDYARFLYLWMNGGSIGPVSLLSEASVARALQPSKLNSGYGYQWEITNTAAAPPVFGHGGSDGTIAIAVPEKDLMVLYFTQSRGTHTTELVRALVLRELGIETHEDFAKTAVGAEVPEDYAGQYQHPQFTVTIRCAEQGLWMSLPDAPDQEFVPASEDFFFHEVMNVQLTFVRDEDGKVIGLIIHQKGQEIAAQRVR